jgi:murein DD-endopeptidase MepM/ murein hydrolase activator NlpD
VNVLLAHLMEGSIKVGEEDEVVEGQIIGQVGNSGNTSQPHLHIHAERGRDEDKQILEGNGVPITFGGRYLVRNSLFTGRKSIEPESSVSASRHVR